MADIRVWTRQHISVADALEKRGRFVADPSFAAIDFGDDKETLLECYRWLAENCPSAGSRPVDASFPIWVSLTRETIQPPQDDFVILELSLEETLVDPVNVGKWGAILNCSYIAADEMDRRRHVKEMEALGLSDTAAFMSRFYPQQKETIKASWARLFDPSIDLGSSVCYGITWQLRREWVRNISQG